MKCIPAELLRPCSREGSGITGARLDGSADVVYCRPAGRCHAVRIDHVRSSGRRWPLNVQIQDFDVSYASLNNLSEIRPPDLELLLQQAQLALFCLVVPRNEARPISHLAASLPFLCYIA